MSTMLGSEAHIELSSSLLLSLSSKTFRSSFYAVRCCEWRQADILAARLLRRYPFAACVRAICRPAITGDGRNIAFPIRDDVLP